MDDLRHRDQHFDRADRAAEASDEAHGGVDWLCLANTEPEMSPFVTVLARVVAT